MQTTYFVLYLLAFVAFVGAAVTSRDNFGRSQPRFTVALVPVGLALITLVWLLQTLNRL